MLYRKVKSVNCQLEMCKLSMPLPRYHIVHELIYYVLGGRQTHSL